MPISIARIAFLHTASIEQTLRSLRQGDMVEVSDSKGRTRTVRITDIDDSPYAYRVYTTSGKVRSRSISGGSIAVHKRDRSITFQPTLQQIELPVVSLQRIAGTH